MARTGTGRRTAIWIWGTLAVLLWVTLLIPGGPEAIKSLPEPLLGLVVGFGLFLPGVAFVGLVVAPPVERILGRVLPKSLKVLLASAFQGGLFLVVLFALAGVLAGSNGWNLMETHSLAFFVCWALATVFFSVVNFMVDQNW